MDAHQRGELVNVINTVLYLLKLYSILFSSAEDRVWRTLTCSINHLVVED